MSSTTFEAEYEKLDLLQRAAVDHTSGPAVVAACAGSGKTRTLTMRTWSLVHRAGVAPEKICACTFSVEAALEISRRLHAWGLPKTLRVGTIHSVCYEIIGPERRVDDKHQYAKFLDEACRPLDRDLSRAHIARFVNRAKALGLPVLGLGSSETRANLLALARDVVSCGPRDAAAVVAAYEAVDGRMAQAGLLTFDDMPLLALQVLQSPTGARQLTRFSHVLVDEAQDSTPVQHQVVALLARHTKNLMLLGDPAQAIYGFRDARVRDFIAAARAPNTRIYPLSTNYRSNKTITDTTNRIVAGASWNLAGAMTPYDSSTPPHAVHCYEAETLDSEADLVVDQILRGRARGRPWSAHAVLYRLSVISRAVETALLAAAIPYRNLASTPFFGRREIRDLTAYLQVAALRDSTGEFTKRALHAPFRYIGRQTTQAAELLAAEQHVALLDALAQTSTGRARGDAAIAEFVRVVVAANRLVCAGAPALAVLDHVLSETDYREWLATKEASCGGPEAARVLNVEELRRIAGSYATVDALLDYIKASASRAKRPRDRGLDTGDKVTIGTVHAWKGLEADHVFLVGAADRFLPIRQADLDEELRIFYVAATRARHELSVSYAKRIVTEVRGETLTRPSPFLARAGLTPVPYPWSSAVASRASLVADPRASAPTRAGGRAEGIARDLLDAREDPA